jgi:hypothetical protein
MDLLLSFWKIILLIESFKFANGNSLVCPEFLSSSSPVNSLAFSFNVSTSSDQAVKVGVDSNNKVYVLFQKSILMFEENEITPEW